MSTDSAVSSSPNAGTQATHNLSNSTCYTPLVGSKDPDETCTDRVTSEETCKATGNDNTPSTIDSSSCLQCSLKALPCNKDQPACSRCARAQAHLCLAQRDLSVGEISSPKRRKRGRLQTLLRLETDDETTWMRKLELEREVSLSVKLD